MLVVAVTSHSNACGKLVEVRGLVGRQHLVEALAARPDEERPWVALRRAFDVLVRVNEEAPEQTLSFLRMVQETPSLRARHFEKQMPWQEQLVPELARRLRASPARTDDPRPTALVAAALACLDAAARTWVASEGSVSFAVLLDRAMGALTD